MSDFNGEDAAQRCNIEADFERLRKIMEDPSFRTGSGLGGEQAFYIYDYPPECELEVRESIPGLIKRLQTMSPKHDGDYAPTVLWLDLYDLVIEILETRKVLQKIIDFEQDRHDPVSGNKVEDKFLALLENMVGADSRYLPDAVGSRFREAREEGKADIVFLTGVGQTYPYVRAHTLLETLQGQVEDKPLVLFYPGRFTTTSVSGSTMSLYGCLPASNYYRARSLRDMMRDER